MINIYSELSNMWQLYSNHERSHCRIVSVNVHIQCFQTWRAVLFTILICLALRNLHSYKKKTKENIICLPRALQRSVHFPNLSVEVQVKQATIQKKKSEVSLHTLISNELLSVVIYVLHDNLKFKLKNLAATQFEQTFSIKRENNSLLKATGSRGNFSSLSESENETHDLDFTQSIFKRQKEGCPLDCGDLKVLLSILRFHLPIAITVNMVKYF